MKSFQIVTLFALVASAMAFSPNQLPQGKFSFCRIFDIDAIATSSDSIGNFLDGYWKSYNVSFILACSNSLNYPLHFFSSIYSCQGCTNRRCFITSCRRGCPSLCHGLHRRIYANNNGRIRSSIRRIHGRCSWNSPSMPFLDQSFHPNRIAKGRT